MSAQALSGIRAIEIGGTVAGAYCTKLLAGLGAEVIKCEPPAGDPLRKRGPFPGDVPHPEKSGAFLHLNTGKLGVTLNLETGSGRDILSRLVADCDVLVESFPPGELDRIELGYSNLEPLNPRLIVVSITPFGQDGPYARHQATEIVTYALSGYMMLTGEPDREPLKAYGDQTELQAGQQAAVAAMVALFAREATGRGQHVDVSVMEAGALLLGGAVQAYYHRGEVIRRAGPRLMGFPPRAFYPSTLRPCRDGYVHAHTNQRNPDLLAVLMDEPRLASPEILEAPMAHADEIDALMDPWLAQHDKRDIVRRAQELRLPFTEVLTPGEVMADPHHRQRGFWVEVDHPIAGKVIQPGPSIRMSRTPWETKRAPLLGEHNGLVYGERLGFTAQDLLILKDRGVI